MRVGIIAPSRPISPEIKGQVTDCAAQFSDKLELRWHKAVTDKHGHFAGTDSTREQALLEFALDPTIDAIWFARGGYGAMRIGEVMFEKLAQSQTARDKVWLGYSDTGAILARLYRLGFENCFHAPMPADILRKTGRAAIDRVFEFLTHGARDTEDTPHLPMNLSVLAALCGTDWMPPLERHILMLEDVGEYEYAIDRMMFTLSHQADFPKLAGVKAGRFSDVPENDVDFGKTPEAIIQHWCAAKGVPYLGRSDIGHDIDNAIVRFGCEG